MAILSLSQAAKAVGVSRSTIYKQVKQGQLSATRLPDGSKGVDTSELLRVFGELHSEAGATEAKVTSPAGSESAVLQRENELLRQQLHAAHEREQRFLAIIEDQQQRLLPPPRKGFLERLADAVNRIRGKYWTNKVSECSILDYSCIWLRDIPNSGGNYMAILNISEAARAAGVARSTIYKKIRDGALSTITRPDGGKGIDTDDLIRVFGELPLQPERKTEPAEKPAEAQAETGQEARLLQQQVDLLQQQLEACQQREQRLLVLLEQEQRLLPGPVRGVIEYLADLLADIRAKMTGEKKPARNENQV